MQFTWNDRAEAYDAHIERILRAAREQEYIEELEDFRKRQKQMGKVCMATGVNVLLVLKSRLDKMVKDNEEIPVSLIPGFVRAAAFMAEYATNAEAQALAVEDVLKALCE